MLRAFRIGVAEVKKRQKNILFGLIFTVALVLTLGWANASNAERYNDFLLGSVVIFLVFANFINGFRFYQWTVLIKTHRVELVEEGLAFWKGKEKTFLLPSQVRRVQFKRSGDAVAVVILELATGAKIRLEGYDNMADFAAGIRKLMPPSVVVVD